MQSERRLQFNNSTVFIYHKFNLSRVIEQSSSTNYLRALISFPTQKEISKTFLFQDKTQTANLKMCVYARINDLRVYVTLTIIKMPINSAQKTSHSKFLGTSSNLKTISA